MISETSKCRDRLSKYCLGAGLDLGFGGDPIRNSSICIDRMENCTRVGDSPQHLTGDVRSLHWFKDNVFNYVFSSHVLEDIPLREVNIVLNEWLRVIKPDGFLVLYLPDIAIYDKYCDMNSLPKNRNHQNKLMSLKWLKEEIAKRSNLQIVHEKDGVGDYSFEVVIRKIK